MLFPLSRIAPAQQDTIDAGIRCGVNKTNLAADSDRLYIVVLL